MMLAAAVGQPSGAWTAGGWHGVRLDDTCLTTAAYGGAGETEVGLFDRGEGTAISIVNTNWTMRRDHRYDVIFEIGPRHISGNVEGLEQGAKRGVLARIERADLAAIAAAQFVAVAVDGRLIDKVSMTGSAAAVARFRECLVEADEFRAAHAPAEIARFFGADAYPPAAMRAGAQGGVTVRVTVGEDGRVTDCAVTTSAGNDDLDSTTCRIMRSRVRFGAGAAGRVVERTIDWKLPPGRPELGQ